METCCADGFVSLRFFFFFWWLKTATGRNGQNDPKLAKIGPKVEHVVLPLGTTTGQVFVYPDPTHGPEPDTIIKRFFFARSRLAPQAPFSLTRFGPK